MRVYVAGPITLGDTTLNIRRGIEVGNTLLNIGHAPYVPHLTHFWQLMFPREYEEWLNLDNQFLPLCEALIRLPGESLGSDKEVSLAIDLGIPVYYGLEAFLSSNKNPTKESTNV